MTRHCSNPRAATCAGHRRINQLGAWVLSAFVVACSSETPNGVGDEDVDSTLEAVTLDLAATWTDEGTVLIDVTSSYHQAAHVTLTATVLRRDGIDRASLPAIDVARFGASQATVAFTDLVRDALTDGERAQVLFTARARYADGLLGTDRGTTPLNLRAREGVVVVTGTDDTRADTGLVVVESETLPLAWRPAQSADEGHAHAESAARKWDPMATLPEGVALPATDTRNVEDTDVVVKADVSFKVCFNATSRFTDSIGGANGEDYFASADWTARELRGNLVYIYRSGVFQGYRWLGDGLDASDPGKGCFDTFTGATGNYSFVVYPYGYVNSNYVMVRDEATLLWGESTAALSITSGGTKNLTLPAGSVQMNVYAAAAYSIWRHAGGGDGDVYDVRTDTTVPGGSQVSGGIVYISASHDQRKFVIAHEMGHRLLAFRTNKGGGDCSNLAGAAGASVATNACPGVSTTHSMTSLEYSSCAFNEGFGHFYAADVFNSDDESDCRFRYYKNEFGDGTTDIVDCESGNGNYVNRFAETCGTNAQIDGFGTELDWMRALWDVHTNGNRPHFNSVLSWIDTAASWSRTTAYDNLDAAANSVAGDVNTNWDAAKTFHGVDH